MKVAVLCEIFGRVRDAFLERGHSAYSLDLEPTENPGPHLRADVMAHLLSLPDGGLDLIIMHPPCTALANSGNATYGEWKPKFAERQAAATWTAALWRIAQQKARAVCLENPRGVLPTLGGLGKPQYIQPWQFGHPIQKETGLFLHNLPHLRPTCNVYAAMMAQPAHKRNELSNMPPSADRAKWRSQTFTGIARAMAEQWGSL